MTQSNADLMRAALREHIAIPAFNIPYLPMMEPVIRAIVDTDSFAFIEVARLEWTKFEAQSPAAIMQEFRKYDNPRHVRIHLDHVPVIDEDEQRVDYAAIVRDAIALGYKSVMVDGSRLNLEDNIAATRQVAELAHAAGIPCEAELGAVLGHSAGPIPPYEELFASGQGFTDVAEATRFVRESQCDWLSVAFGNIHGAVSGAARDARKTEARLNLEHLDRLRDATNVPLVLHGGSGVRQEYVLEAIKRGIAKVNVGTEIRQAYETPLRNTGDLSAAQQSLYLRTVELIRDYFGLTGSRQRILGE